MVYPRHLDSRYLRGLVVEWNKLNRDCLRGALLPPVFELTDAETKLGSWTPATRTITLSRRLVYREPWGTIVEVLKHEVAHQYVSEVLKAAVGETAHGPAFHDVCERFGIDSSASGMPEPNAADKRVHDRIAKLLALAASTNRHEAESAMAQARKLMLVHNIETTPSHYTWRHLGRPTKRVQQYERSLAGLLSKHFFVQVVWVHVFDAATDSWASVLEVCGTPGNVEMAEWVYRYLLDTADRLWLSEPLRGAANKQRFAAGIVRGFAAKLDESAKATTEAGLVWVGDPAVKEYLGKRYGRLRTITYQVRTGNLAFESGFAKGKDIVLHKPVGGSTGASGRLLTGTRGRE